MHNQASVMASKDRILSHFNRKWANLQILQKEIMISDTFLLVSMVEVVGPVSRICRSRAHNYKSICQSVYQLVRPAVKKRA